LTTLPRSFGVEREGKQLAGVDVAVGPATADDHEAGGGHPRQPGHAHDLPELHAP
jgi:hypothetical protein